MKRPPGAAGPAAAPAIRVLGIDPGSRVVGYAVVEVQGSRRALLECGSLHVEREPSFALRLLRIHAGLAEVIARTSPTLASIEEVHAGKSFRSAEKLGEGRGVALLACAQAGLPVHEYSPTAVKKSVTGRGNAHKDQVSAMVRRMLALPDRVGRDAADAAAIALTHLHRGAF